MINIRAFQLAARENGYVEVDEYQWGDTIWFMKPPTKDSDDCPMRLCIDRLTDSVTVFWQSAPAKINSKTFRTVASLKEWLESIANNQYDRSHF